MSPQVCSVGLLLCSVGLVLVQTQRTSELGGGGGGPDRPRGVWDPPIHFVSKGGDECVMLVTGQRDTTVLRVSCRGPARSYWCQYVGRPHVCRSYSNDPRHYFVQMMWGLRKLQHACRGPGSIKPHMCRQAPDDAQMVLVVSSNSQQRPESTRTSVVQQRPESTRTSVVQQRPESTRTSVVQQRPAESGRTRGVRMKTDQRSSRPRPVRPLRTRPPTAQRPRPLLTPTPSAAEVTTAAAHRKRDHLAQSYCWRSLQGVCSYVIGLFQQ